MYNYKKILIILFILLQFTISLFSNTNDYILSEQEIREEIKKWDEKKKENKLVELYYTSLQTLKKLEITTEYLETFTTNKPTIIEQNETETLFSIFENIYSKKQKMKRLGIGGKFNYIFPKNISFEAYIYYKLYKELKIKLGIENILDSFYGYIGFNFNYDLF